MPAQAIPSRRTTDYAPYPVLRLACPNSPVWSRFLDEVLIQEGLLCVDHAEARDAEGVESALAGRAVVIVLPGHLSPSVCESLSRYVRRGGAALLIDPQPELVASLGLEVRQAPGEHYGSAPPAYLRLAEHPWAGAHGEALLQCHAPTRLWQIGGVQPVAWHAPQPEVAGPWPALVEGPCGAGRIAVCWFDPGAHLVLTRQGLPRLASSGVGAGTDAEYCGMHKASGLYTGHLDFALRDVPQADVLADVLVACIRGLAEPALPLPRVHHLPHNAPALTLLDGDSDLLGWDRYDRLLEHLSAARVPFTLNVHPKHFDGFDRRRVESVLSSGNDLELHHVLPLRATPEEVRGHVAAQHEGFLTMTGGLPTVGSRGHSLIWPGYTDAAEALAELGWRLVTNLSAFRRYQYGYLNGSGRAARFVTEAGRTLPIANLSTLAMDDILFSDKSLLPPMTPDQAYTRICDSYDRSVGRYHGVLNVAIHPGGDYGGGLDAMVRAVIDSTRRHRLPAMTVREWVRFQEARRKVDVSLRNGRWRLRAAEAIAGLTCSSARHGARVLDLTAGQDVDLGVAAAAESPGIEVEAS